MDFTKAGINRVIVKLIDMNDKINFNGTKLFISTKYNAQDHVPVWGEVVALPSARLNSRILDNG